MTEPNSGTSISDDLLTPAGDSPTSPASSRTDVREILAEIYRDLEEPDPENADNDAETTCAVMSLEEFDTRPHTLPINDNPELPQ